MDKNKRCFAEKFLLARWLRSIFDKSDTPVNYTVTLDEKAYTAGTIINAKGYHELEIIAIDKSGNTAVKKVKFRID